MCWVDLFENILVEPIVPKTIVAKNNSNSPISLIGQAHGLISQSSLNHSTRVEPVFTTIISYTTSNCKSSIYYWYMFKTNKIRQH